MSSIFCLLAERNILFKYKQTKDDFLLFFEIYLQKFIVLWN